MNCGLVAMMRMPLGSAASVPAPPYAPARAWLPSAAGIQAAAVEPLSVAGRVVSGLAATQAMKI
jgi:hypothetical protein